MRIRPFFAERINREIIVEFRSIGERSAGGKSSLL